VRDRTWQMTKKKKMMTYLLNCPSFYEWNDNYAPVLNVCRQKRVST
jgi:hypothetical protein